MVFLYNTIILLVRVLANVASLFDSKTRLLVKGHRQLSKKITLALASNQSPVVWVHCASLGEFEQGRPVIESFKKSYPATKIVLTFFSPSGFEVRKNYAHSDLVFYLQWDTEKNATYFI